MMDRPQDIYAPLAVQNWVEYTDWLEAERDSLQKALESIKMLSRVPLITDIAESALERTE
jgi:hypothetical protein